MDCKQARELITASLDGELEAHHTRELLQHAATCRTCRNEIELERMTKSVVRRQLSRAATPSQLSSRIAERLAAESYKPRAAAATPWRRLLTLPMRKAVFALSGAAILLFSLFVVLPSNRHHSHTVPNDANIIHQTYSSFDGLMKGSVIPQITSADPAAVKTFFAQRVNFNVDVPRLSECQLMGGASSQFNNEDVAQVIYKHGDDMIYLYEARYDSVINGRTLNLPDEARLELQRTGWYVENHVPQCTLIVWKADSTTICCAIAEMSKERLLACLQDAN